MNAYYNLRHKYKLEGHIEVKQIGIYSSLVLAEKEKLRLMEQRGFCDYPNNFKIKKVYRLFRPKLLDKTYWDGGFDTYRY